MKRLVLIGMLLAAPAAAWAEPPAHVVNEADATLTLDCADGGRVTVNGSANTITVTGGCEKVTVNGSGNTVAVAGADKIVVTGSGNTITYGGGWKKKAPKLSRLGENNEIARK